MKLEEALEILKENDYLAEYVDAPKGPSTFGRREYEVNYNWWPSDRAEPDSYEIRVDKVWLLDPTDDDEITAALSEILREGSPEIEILSVE